MTDWTETYRPQTLDAIRGNDKARDELRHWATSWPSEGKAVILHGSPGIGKTSAAHAVAHDMNWEPIELNASDQRTAAVIETIAGEAAATATLSGRRKVVILDEADNLHGNVDRGGAAAMTRVIKAAEQPVILIANEFYEMGRGLRNACETIEFRDVSARSIVPVLRDICRKEDVPFEEEALRQIAEQTDGDLRSAINDLQAIAERTEMLTVGDVVTDERDQTEGIFPFLDTVFKEATPQEALQAAYAVDETPDDLLAWIEDNVHKVYADEELAGAYGRLAAADRWLGRVRATQNYGYWRYVTGNVAAGVAAARTSEKGGWTRYGPPSYWRKLGRSRGARDKRDRIARAIAETSGVSMSTARREILPFLASMTHHCTNRELTVAMAARYDLDEELISFVTGSGADTNKVKSIVEDARSIDDERIVAAAPTGGLEEVEDESLMPDEANSSPEDGTGTPPEDEDEEEEEDDGGQAGLADFF